MNISNIQQYLNAGSYMSRIVPTDLVTHVPMDIKNKNSEADVLVKEPSLPNNQKEEPKKKDTKPDWESLVMKPSPISLEERMSQVISPEQVKDLLSLIARFPIQDKEQKHNLDVKR